MTPNRSTTHRSGNIMILVVVVIVLMALLGATYLQVARVQRSIVDDPIDNIDLVLESVIQKIGTTLKDDVISSSDGNLFGADVEPFDYPVTNYVGAVTVQGVSGPLATQAQFGQNDDAWLANTAPYINGGNLTWRKISLLCGAYYPTDGATIAEPLLRNVLNGIGDGNASVVRSGVTDDSDVDVTDQDLVDTDGDGIGDAKYERAPITLMSGREYFMAVRIIDASSLINLNAATALTSDGVTPGQVTGYFPTSLDLSRLAYKQTGNSPAATFANFFGDGFLRDANPGAGVSGPGTGSYPTPFGMTSISTYNPYSGTGYGNGQIQAWLEATGRPGDLATYVNPLAEMLWRGGMDNAALTTPYETQLGNAAGNTLGTPYTPLNTTAKRDNPVTATNSAEQHFLGRDSGGTSPPANVTVAEFDAIRHMVTTVSGAAVYSPNYANMHGGFGRMDDLVYQQSGLNGAATDAQARVDRLQASLNNIFGLGGGSPSAARSAAVVSGEFALAIQEYSDPDGTPSAVYNDGADNYYGLEALPFLREAYFQVAYGAPTGTPPGTAIAWNPVVNGSGFAVEMANPFDRPITIAAADPNSPAIRVALIDSTGAVLAGTEYILPDGTIGARDPSAALPDRHVLAVVSEGSAAPVEDTSTGVIATDVVNNPAPDASYTTITATADLISAASVPLDGATDIGVALQVEIPKGTGTWVTYDRLFNAGTMSFPATVDFSNAAGGAIPPAVKTSGYIQKWIQRDDTPNSYVSNEGKTSAAREPTDPTIPIGSQWPEGIGADPGGPYTGIFDGFGVPNGITGEPLTSFQIPVANRPIFSVAELGWIFMFGFSDTLVDGLGNFVGDFPQRFSGTGPAAGGIPDNERYLQFGGGGATDIAVADADGDGTGDTTYTDAVLSEFTTLHPGYDGIDNDGDGDIDLPTDDDEQFVFGTANINTMPAHLAVVSAPYPDSLGVTESLMLDATNGIITQRDGTGLGQGPFVSIGQLARYVAGVTAPAIGTADAFDLYPLFESTVAGGGNAEYYTFTATNPEALMKRAQFLTQAYSVRSDIYIAFILVKGYDSGNLGTVKESARAIVVFDRGRLTGSAGDETKELGRYRY